MMSSFYKHLSLVVLFASCLFGQEVKGATQPDSMMQQKADFLVDRAIANLFENWDSSRWYLEAAIPLYEEIENWNGYVTCYNGLFFVDYTQENYAGAEGYAQKAWTEAQRLLQADNATYGDALSNIALIYETKGDYSRSLALQRRVVELTRTAQGDPADIATGLINIAQIYQTRGDWDGAIPYLEESRQLLIEALGPSHVRVGYGHFLLGRVYQEKGAYKQAIDFYLQSQRVLTPLANDNDLHKKRKIDLYQRLAETYTEAHQAERSVAWLQKALAIQQNYDYRNYLTYEIWGKTYEALGQDNQALDAYQKALQLAKAKFTDFARHRIVARQHANLGDFYKRAKQFEKALAQYQEGLSRISFDYEPEQIAQNPALADVMSYPEALTLLSGKGDALRQQYQSQPTSLQNLKHSLASFVAYRELAQDARLDYHSKGSKNLLASEAVAVYEKALEVAHQLLAETDDPRYLQEAFAFAESNKAMLLLESINQQQANKAGGIPDSLLELESQLRVDLNFYNRLIAEERSKEAASSENIAKYQKEKYAVQQTYDGLLQRLETNYPSYQQIKDDIELVDIESVQANLPDEESMLLEYFVGKKFFFVFAITKQQTQLLQLPIADNQAQQIQVLLNSLHTYPGTGATPYTFADFSQAAHDLYRFWLASILTEPIAKNINHLILVPDGSLSLLPFEVLLQSLPDAATSSFHRDLDYLFRDYAIRYAYSATLLHRSESFIGRRAKQSYAGFAPSFANPAIASLRSCSLEELYRLPCSEAEIQQVQNLLGGQTFVQEAATRQSFVKQASAYQVLHLATHACIDEENPEYGRIYFSDDYLSNEELFSLELAADLIVLSACNTGSGKIVSGEGVMSLAKGFTYAGVASSLISLWSIDDCATSELIDLYFQELDRGETKAKALQQSRLRYLETADKLHQHPFFWAAFVQMDNDSALSQTRTFSRKVWWAIGGVAALGLVFGLWYRARP